MVNPIEKMPKSAKSGKGKEKLQRKTNINLLAERLVLQVLAPYHTSNENFEKITPKAVVEITIIAGADCPGLKTQISSPLPREKLKSQFRTKAP